MEAAWLGVLRVLNQAQHDFADNYSQLLPISLTKYHRSVSYYEYRLIYVLLRP